MLQAFNTWVCNMRSDRAFLDSKLYTKLVNQLAKERVRNVDLGEISFPCSLSLSTHARM